MATRAELEQELNKAVIELYEAVTKDRGLGVDPNDTHNRMDKFLVEWSGKLTEEREIQKQEALQDIELDHPQIIFGSTVFTERDRAARVNADALTANTIIDQDILDMRERLAKSVIEIEQGNVPNLSFQPDYYVEPLRNRAPKNEPLAGSWDSFLAHNQEREQESSMEKDGPDHELEL